jgi:hypothetical protein
MSTHRASFYSWDHPECDRRLTRFDSCNFYVRNNFSLCAKHVSCRAFKAAEQVFVIWAKHHESRQCIHKNEPPSVDLGLLDSQRVSAKFWHHTHPRRVYVVLEFAFSLSLATMAECCQNTDFGTIRFGFAVTLLTK